jgi:signal transduction histidine kinase
VICNFDDHVGTVWMDSEKMKQVVLNLLSNAMEFSPEGGRIEITTRLGPEIKRRRSVVIEVADNGPGIHPSMIDKIFDPYFTTKHKSHMHSGTGLGLFIVHQNVHDHGGTIEVQSEVERGTTFIVTLPLTPPSNSDGKPEAEDGV